MQRRKNKYLRCTFLAIIVLSAKIGYFCRKPLKNRINDLYIRSMNKLNCGRGVSYVYSRDEVSTKTKSDLE